MASNDTNSWDEDPDERLRRRWQQVFADFEVQARPSLSRHILDRLTPSPPRRRGRWLAVAALLLLISGGVVYQIRIRERSSLGRGHSATAKYTKPIQPPSAGRLRQPAAPIGQSVSPSLPMIDPLVGRSLTEWQLPVHSPIVPGVDTSQMSTTTPETPRGRAFGVAALSERRAVTRPWPAGRARLLSRARVQVTPRPEKKLLLSKSARLFSALFTIRTVGRAIITGHELPSAPEERSGSHSYSPLAAPHSSVTPPLSNALPIGWALLTPHGFSLLPSRLLTLPDQLSVFSSRPLHQVGIVVTRQRWHWFVDAIPLSSFQWMNTPPASTAYLSNVNAPANFSPATWGYQLNGGIRFQRWQAYLSVGQLRRWAYYTVNENRYRVEPSPTDPQQLVRETYSVAENVALPMIGMGLSQQKILAQGRYTVDFGGQVSYLPTSEQTLLSLRGGAARRLAVSRLTELQVGLSIEYGLNQLLSEHRQLAIHPLMVGLKFRLQPRSQP